MIYKFIDNNGSEISVNSLESLQALVDSDTINENTKVKAGLRGKWTTASKIEGLNFTIQEEVENIPEPEEDIKSFITQSENSNEKEEVEQAKEIVVTKKVEEKIYDEENEAGHEAPEYQNNESSNDTSDYYTEKFDKTENINNDDPSISFKDSWAICLNKLTDFTGRASRSEFWKFYLSFLVLFITILFGILVLIIIANPNISDGALEFITYAFSIPAALFTLSATVRRLHDTNKSGWFVLLGLIPFIGLILLILLILPSDEEKNKYGKNPLKQ